MEQDFEFAEAVDKVATYLAPKPDQVDVLGYLQDDYRSELSLEAWLASKVLRGQHRGSERTRYVLKALWNYARTRNRSRYRRNRHPSQTFDRALDPVDLESQVEARSSLRKLQKNLDKTSLAVLIQLAEANGEVSKAWTDGDQRYHRRYFSVKVKQARAAGQKVLQN